MSKRKLLYKSFWLFVLLSSHSQLSASLAERLISVCPFSTFFPKERARKYMLTGALRLVALTAWLENATMVWVTAIEV